MEYSSQPVSNPVLNWWLDQLVWVGLNAYFFPMKAITFGDDINFWMNYWKSNAVICKPIQ